MASHATPGMMKGASSWDISSAGESAQDHSTADSAEWQDNNQPDHYQSRLAEIDKMIDGSYSKNAANKVRHGKQYRAVRKVSMAQSKGEEVDVQWLDNEEADLWYTHSKEPFPGGMFSTEDNGSAWGVMSNQSSTAGKTTSAWDISNLNGAGKVEQVSGRFDSEIQDYVSSSDSDTGGAKLDIDWDVYKTAYIQTKLDHKSASATSPKADAKSSVSSTGESDKENMDGDTKKEGHAQDGDDVSAIINGVLSHATKKVTFNKAKPMSLGSFFQEDTTVYDGAAKSNRSASTRKAAKTPSSVRYADMKSTSISRTKIPKSSLQQPSAVYNSRFAVSTSVMSEYPANKSGRLRSHVLNAGACGQLDGIDGGKYGIDRQRDFSISEEPHSHQSSTQTRRRGSRRASILQPPTQDNGWIEFRDPKHAQTSPPAAKHSQNTANTITAENDAKKSAALKAWANFPAQAAKEDREAAAAYEAPVTLGLITNTMAAAPVIKETYKKVIVSDRFERKVVEKRVDIIQ